MDVLATGAWDRLKSNEELIDNDDALPARLEVETLGKLSTKLLPALFKLVDSLHDTSSPKAEDEMIIENVGSAAEKDAARVTAVTQAIASIARLTPKSQIQGLFTKIVQRMLQTSQVSGDGMMLEKMCALLALSQALVASECLDDSSVSLLYRSVRPLIRTDETPPRIQKRAYKVLAEICKRYHSFVADPERLQEVLELLSSTSATSQVSARSMRLKCLNFVAEGFGNSLIQDRQVSLFIA
jgi:ribosomal RNA-processing protein 12